MAKEYPHASFLTNVGGMPRHWFTHKKIPKKNDPIYFYNAKEGYKSLVITDGLTGVFHVMYDGATLKTFKTKQSALKFAKSYMRRH